MKRPPSALKPEDLGKFRGRFLNVLQGYYRQEPLIPDILGNETLSRACAALLWPCVNGSSARLAEMSKKWKAYWDSKFKDAIPGVEAAENIYKGFDNKPELVEFLRKARQDLFEKQRQRKQARQPTLPSKWLGRDRDWAIVQVAKEALESLLSTHLLNQESILRKGLPYRTLAALLNAASQAQGLPDRYSAEAIQRALTRLKTRRIA